MARIKRGKLAGRHPVVSGKDKERGNWLVVIRSRVARIKKRKLAGRHTVESGKDKEKETGFDVTVGIQGFTESVVCRLLGLLLLPLSTSTACVGFHCLCVILLSLSAMLTLTTGCRNLLIGSPILL